MKKVALNIIIAALLCAAAFTSCKSRGSGNVKLLETITDDDGSLIKKFEYDEQNRIVKIYGYDAGGDLRSTTSITYGADESVTVEWAFDDVNERVMEFVRNGNTVTAGSETLTVNKDGYLVKREGEGQSYAYQYRNGNSTAVDKYDDKKSPLSNTTTPKWLIRYLDEWSDYANKNNSLGHSWEGETTGSVTYTYEYDSDGFPTKRTKEWYTEGAEGTEITRFTYLDKTKNTPVQTAKTQAAAKSDTLYITETGYVQIWIPDEDYVDETGDGTFYMGNALGKVRELGLEGVSVDKERYVSFALAGGKQHVIKTNDMRYDILLYRKGYEPVALDLGSEMPITDEAYVYLGLAFIDSRDGKTYRTVAIGGKTWMAENLNYQTGDSRCYNNDESNCAKYGRLYGWNTATDACPTGWHLPSHKEWENLVTAVGGVRKQGENGDIYWDVAGKKLKSNHGWNYIGDYSGANDYGFFALPGGSCICNEVEGDFYHTCGEYGFWWTATEFDESKAYYMEMGYNNSTVTERTGPKEVLNLSVRCVKND